MDVVNKILIATLTFTGSKKAIISSVPVEIAAQIAYLQDLMSN